MAVLIRTSGSDALTDLGTDENLSIAASTLEAYIVDYSSRVHKRVLPRNNMELLLRP